MVTYEDFISALFSRHQSVQDAGFTADAYKPGLDRMLALDRAAGSPSTAFPSVHVAGTNGKGSVCSLLAASLAGSGLRVGLYTSPHLLDFRERIKVVSGEPTLIPREAVMEFAERYDRTELSFFEFTTGLAFWWFARQEVDIAVIEVGLGGRLDATNILTPELCVVTSIGLDHCALLGDTRALIAAEKAGIFKPGVPALVGSADAETAPVFEAAAARVHCPLFWADETEPAGIEIASRMDLKGEWQRENLRTALCALELLGQEPDLEAMAHAAARTGLRGRWEQTETEPLTITDIGHNPPALRRNFAELSALMQTGRFDRLIIVYGVMADKDLDGILPLIPAGAQCVFATPSTPRALPAEQIRARYGAGLAAPDVASALALARSLATPRSLLYVGGSTFVVADYLRLLSR